MEGVRREYVVGKFWLVSAPLTIHIDLNQVKLDPNFEYKARSFLHTIPTLLGHKTHDDYYKGENSKVQIPNWFLDKS